MPSDEARRRGWLSRPVARSILRRPGARKMIAFLIALSHVAGVLCSVDAVMKNRTAQGAIAWSVSLVSVPYVMVPIYLVFGTRGDETPSGSLVS